MNRTKFSSLLVAGALCAVPAWTFGEDRAADAQSDARNPADVQNDATDATGAAQDLAADGAAARDRLGGDAAIRPGADANDDAAQPAAARTGARAGEMSYDQLFVAGASCGGQMELEAAKLAAQKAQRPEVKEFAKQIIADHTKANQRLKQIAQSKQIQVPQQLKASQRAAIQELSELDGEMFDKAYIISNVGDHMKMVLWFQDASKNLKDAQLKSFASETLPKLQAHLQHAQQLAGWNDARTAAAREPADPSAQDGNASDRNAPDAAELRSGKPRAGEAGDLDTAKELSPGADDDASASPDQADNAGVGQSK